MIEQEPTFRRFDRHRSGADLGGLPTAFRAHHKAVLAPMDHIRAHTEVNISKRSMPVITRPTEHDVLVINLAWERYAIAIVRKQGVLQKVKFLEIKGIANPNGWTMESVAPHDIVAVFDPTDAWIILVLGISTILVSVDPFDCSVIQLPVDPILAKTAMNIHVPLPVVAAEDACKRTVEWDHGAVENTIRGWNQVAWDDWVVTVTPDNIGISSRSFFPGNIGQNTGWGRKFHGCILLGNVFQKLYQFPISDEAHTFKNTNLVRIEFMNRPYTFVNVAMSADGKLDNVARKGMAISSPADKARVDRLRASVDAVLVGGRTLLDEDPKLTIKSKAFREQRLTNGLEENPVKVGMVSLADLDLECNFLTAGPARRLIYTTQRTSPGQISRLENAGARVFILGKEHVDAPATLASLHDQGIRKLMVEGGGTIIAEFFRLGLVDELTIYLAPFIIGGASAPTLTDGPGFLPQQMPHLRLEKLDQYDEDGGVFIHYLVL